MNSKSRTFNGEIGGEDWQKLYEKGVEHFTWFKPYQVVFDNSDPVFPKWFCGGEISLCYELLDRKVEEGRGNDVIFLYDSFYTKETRRITYNDLLNDVSKLAGAFRNEADIEEGDHILIILPMIPETVLSILAAVRLGAVYNVLIGSSSAKATAERIDDFQPKLVVVATVEHDINKTIYPKDQLDEAIELSASKPKKCFVLQRQNILQKPSVMNVDRDVDFYEAMGNSCSQDYVSLEVNSPVYVTYTSGTTGAPKGIVKSIRRSILLIDEHKELMTGGANVVTWSGSTFAFGWGNGWGIFASMYWNKTFVLYEGPVRNPEIHEFYRILSTYKVKQMMHTSAVYRLIRQKDPDGEIAKLYQPFSIKSVISCGCAGDVLTFNWLKRIYGTLISQNYGMTELAGIVDTSKDQPIMSCGKPRLDMRVHVLRKDGTQADTNEAGRIAVKLPLPPTCMTTINNNDERYKKYYFSEFPGYFDTKDLGKLDENGFLYVLGRSGDAFEANGHWVTCFSLEETMMSHPDVAECVAVVNTVGDGEPFQDVAVCFFMLKEGALTPTHAIGDDLLKLIHENIGEFVPVSKLYLVDSLPQTNSGKVARAVIQDLLRNIHTKTAEELNDPRIVSLAKALTHNKISGIV